MGTVEVLVTGNDGADHAALSQDDVDKLAQKEIYVPILNLVEPVRMQLAGSGSDQPLVIFLQRNRIFILL